jgi:hypothetical protein
MSEAKPQLRIRTTAYLTGGDNSVWSIGGMITGKGKSKYSEKNFPFAILHPQELL